MVRKHHLAATVTHRSRGNMSDVDADKLARLYLTGVEGEGRSTDSGPIDGLLRDWERMHNTQRGRELGEAIVRCVADADPELRFRALQFLNAIQTGALTEAVLPFVRGSRALFKGVYVDGRDVDLEFMLLRVMAKLIDSNADALELARKEALRPDGQPSAIAARMAKVDRNWVRTHREEIERLHPDTKPAFDNNLK